MTKLTALFLLCLTITPSLSSEPVPFSINTKKWSHVLDDHFISITVNPTDLLQGKVYGLAMNSTMAILKGLAPAYVRIGSADTAKYTFKRNRYPSDMVKPEDEYTVTETHWMVFNEVAQSAGLDVIVCLNAAHRVEGTKKWDTRNSLELISFSDSQGYNLTWQLGYEVQAGDDLSGVQFGKDLNRLRTILNAFPRYQQAKLIGPDIRVIHKREESDFWNDMLTEAGPTLDAVTWHPRWPQPSKMKVSDNSDLGYEFPTDYLEWDKVQLNKILQKSVFKNPVWIGETKRESTGTFAEGLMWARRLVVAAKLGIEVVMKQPNLMDISHPKPEYWIALLHKRLLGKSVLETRSVANNTDLAVISHCTNPHYWSDKPEKLQDGPVTVYGVNMGGLEQKIQIKGTWSGKSQLLFQYVLTSGSDPDSVFSQMTYLNGEPLMMTDDGMLPDIIPRIKKLEKGLTMKLPPYSIGFWVVPDAKVKICQVQPHNIPTINIETLTPSSSIKSAPNLQNIRDINQFIVDKLTNPESDSEEVPEVKIEAASSESSEKDLPLLSKENVLPRVARRIRQVKPIDELNQELKTIMQETEEFLTKPDTVKTLNLKMNLPKATPSMERRIQTIAEGISDAIKTTNQEHEFNKFLEDSGLKKDFGSLLVNDRRYNAPGMRNMQPYFIPQNEEIAIKTRLRRSILEREESSQEESAENKEAQALKALKFAKKISLVGEQEEGNPKPDLIIPHNPDLKGLEERYKFIVQSKIQDGKRKIDDIKRKIMQEEEIPLKVKQPEAVNDIQEEIIKKEIELLQKTEETVADILKNQKKRQETFEDIIFDELKDVKGERITALKEMHRNQRKKENSIVKRQAQPTLSRPLFKTVEYIEKNLNLEPESVKKIKRSLEEKMGEILRNYDTKKSLETKKRFVPQKEERKIQLKKSLRDEERKNEEYEERKRVRDRTDDVHVTKERPKEKNVIRKLPSSKLHHTTKPNKRQDSISKEPSYKTRKSEEHKRKQEEDENDSFEMFNQKKLEEPVKKMERKRPIEKADVKSLRSIKKESKSVRKEEPEISENYENERKKKDEEKKKESIERIEKDEEEIKAKTSEKVIPLKNDKSRRENMLKKITSLVDHMNSMERNGDRSKRMDEDEGVSEEFESDRRSRKVKRWPRKADAIEIKSVTKEQQLAEKTVDTMITEVPTSTPPSRLAKLRKRIRPNRRLKDKKINLEKEKGDKTGLDEETKSKRHLAGFDRPLLELEKKKIFKPKIKKFFPKLTRHGNELTANEKEEVEGFQTPIETPKTSEPDTTVQKQNEELLKDIEEIIEEKVFLGQDSKTLKEMSETNGKKKLEQKDIKTDFSGETPTPTEGYIIVEPTIDTDPEEKLVTENIQMVKAENPSLMEDENTSGDKKNEKMEESKPEAEVEKPSKELEDENDKLLQLAKSKEAEESGENEDYVQLSEPRAEKQNDYPSEEVKENEKEVQGLESSDQEKDSAEIEKKPAVFLSTALSPEGSKNYERSEEEIINSPSVAEEGKGKREEKDVDKLLSKKAGIEGNLRKRRATFLPNLGKESEDEEDYSSEERIQKFKQMVYKKSPAKKVLKNEVRPSSGMGMGADEFIRMAGSTVRVMFDDVIPEAYGQTKSKIQNMGIPEYIKEFGKIVQQMKNLDQIFLNIGEAAVKGYIRGNRKEKGPYIQVISRKKRSTGEESLVTDLTEGEATEATSSEENAQMTEIIKPEPLTADSSFLETTAGSNSEQATTEGTTGSIEYATTSTEETIAADKRSSHRSSSQYGSKFREGIPQIYDGKTSNTANTDNFEKTKTEEKTPKTSTLKQDDSKTSEVDKPLFDLKSVSNPIQAIKNEIPKISKQIQSYFDKNDGTSFVKDNGLVRKANPHMSEEINDKLSPWIKTTKDFIQQALTTLQRQRELSEILARESINDLMNRELTKKSVEKRDVSSGEASELPVHHKKNQESNRKRETQQKFSDESLIRHLRGLQPGVYVVPTEEMTNIRSEQIMNEAQQKSGKPNVVTLNIYYDKKNQETSAKISDSNNQNLEPVVSQDVATYFQNKAWNTANGQYDQSNQYAQPVASVPELNLANPVISSVPSLQANPIYAVEPRIAELPNSRLIQYPSPAYHYPPIPRYPSIVPNPQSVYGPVYYLPPENRFIPQPPGTKRQWREFKARSSVNPNFNTGWNIQYETVPGSVRSSIKPLSASSYNKHFKIFSDKKRSVGDFKMEPNWSETALPFWKFFSTSSDTKKTEKAQSESGEKEETKSAESESLEDLFAENRKRAKEADEKKPKSNAVETEPEEDKKEEEEKSRKRRSVIDNITNKLPLETESRKIRKRSYPYHIEFKDHDILPEWFGTYQEIGNSLDHLPPHVRRSHIVSTPWSDEDEELQAILDADDQLSLVDLDDSDDYYYSNDNTLEHLRRYPRSTDQFDSNMIKTNMIYKMPVDSNHVKPKALGMAGIKKLTDEDSSLELVTKSEDKPMSSVTTRKPEMQTQTSTGSKKPEQTPTQQPQVPVKQMQQILLNGTQLPQNGTILQGRNPNDDTFYYFFKYAYDSLVKVMKSMTELF